MSAVEDRLRDDLPVLADRLMGTSSAQGVADERRSAVHEGVDLSFTDVAFVAGRERRPRSRWPSIAAVAATLAVVAVGLGTLVGGDGGPVVAGLDTTSGGGAKAPDFGAWEAMAAAPIGPRSHPVAVWTGEEVVIAAGSNLERNFAHSGGVAYDPSGRTWRSIPELGWAHPGATGVFHDGELYVVAKGGVARFDPVTGAGSGLPGADEMFLSAVVSAADGVWGLGPASVNPGDQPDLAIARYDAQADRWVHGSTLPVTTDGSTFEDAFWLERPPLWTGSEIVVWDRAGGGPAFDPEDGTWRQLPPLVPGDRRVVDSAAVSTAEGLVAVAVVETDGARRTDVAVLVDGAWAWRDVDLPVDALDTATVAAAGSWLVVLVPDRAPVVMDLRTGEWSADEATPIDDAQAPAAVWTGQELVVWGGLDSSLDPDGERRPVGTTWTPPAS